MSNSSIIFTRQKDGSVLVTSWLSGVVNSGRADQAVVDVVDREWIIDVNRWAHIVAGVSEKDSQNRVEEALAFHGPLLKPTT